MVELWGDPHGDVRRMSGDQEIIAIVTDACTEEEWLQLCHSGDPVEKGKMEVAMIRRALKMAHDIDREMDGRGADLCACRVEPKGPEFKKQAEADGDQMYWGLIGYLAEQLVQFATECKGNA